MDAALRREKILEIINHNKDAPVSASLLAKNLNVSRQVIVGDIALLRAQGHNIIATARGYVLLEFRGQNQFLGTVACQHDLENTKSELYTVVDLGALVVNVIVEHELYGEITGQLNLKSREDVDIFINKVEALEIKLLSELTSGIHLHAIACRDKAHFEQVRHALDMAGFLFRAF